MTYRAYDLCCGRGGWTKGLQAHGFEVVGFDVEHHKGYPGDDFVQADVRLLEQLQDADVVVSSPPCTGFSEARPNRIDRPNKDDMDIVLACLRVSMYSKPKFWVLENVRGMHRYLGPAALRYGPFHFWGYFPRFMKGRDDRYHHWGRDISKMRVRDPAIRAEIPYEIASLFGAAFKKALDDR